MPPKDPFMLSTKSPAKYQKYTEVCSPYITAKGLRMMASISWKNPKAFPRDCIAVLIKCGSFKEDPVRSMPDWLALNGQVKWLSMPQYFWDVLKPGGLPPKLESLWLQHDYGSPARRDDLAFPSIVALQAELGNRPENAFMFSRLTFPNLEMLRIAFDKKSKMLPVLAEYKKLSQVQLYNCQQTEQIFEALAPSPLKAVTLAMGVKSLKGIERWQNLEELWLRDHRTLTDLSPLAELPKLKRIQIWDCHQITSVDPLLKLKLTAVDILNCKALSKKGADSLERLDKKNIAYCEIVA